MGMFDTVQVDCPNCGHELDFQSKAGPCILATYTPNNVPIEIALDLHEEYKWCPKCDEVITLRLPCYSATVAMQVD